MSEIADQDRPDTGSKRNVLVVAYYFPPMGLSGVQRTLKFVKYLPQFGWQPTVLTVAPTGYFAMDYSLLKEIEPREILIERVGSWDANRLFRRKGVVRMPSEAWRRAFTLASDLFFIPDNKIGWKKRAVRAGEELFRRKTFDVIFATAPPFTDFLIGLALHERFQKPLVIDYRDPWIEYPNKTYPTPLHRLLNTRLEKKVLHASARVITTNRRVKELILKRHKFLTYQDITILPQGFDPEDFQQNGTGQVGVEPGPERKMRITHTGTLYGDRTPRFFLEALHRIFSREPALRGQIEVVFVGTVHDDFVRLIASLGLQDCVVTTGYLDHADSVRHLKAADVLWMMVPNDRQSPGKLYEYFGAHKPIIACVPDGFLRQAVAEAEAGICVEPENADALASAILQSYRQFKSGRLPVPSPEVISKYNRIELANELSKIFGFLAE